jgi:hypothetical protein
LNCLILRQVLRTLKNSVLNVTLGLQVHFCKS